MRKGWIAAFFARSGWKGLKHWFGRSTESSIFTDSTWCPSHCCACSLHKICRHRRSTPCRSEVDPSESNTLPTDVHIATESIHNNNATLETAPPTELIIMQLLIIHLHASQKTDEGCCHLVFLNLTTNFHHLSPTHQLCCVRPPDKPPWSHDHSTGVSSSGNCSEALHTLAPLQSAKFWVKEDFWLKLWIHRFKKDGKKMQKGHAVHGFLGFPPNSLSPSGAPGYTQKSRTLHPSHCKCNQH